MARKARKAPPAEADTTNGKFAQGWVNVTYVPPAIREIWEQVERELREKAAAREGGGQPR